MSQGRSHGGLEFLAGFQRLLRGSLEAMDRQAFPRRLVRLADPIIDARQALMKCNVRLMRTLAAL